MKVEDGLTWVIDGFRLDQNADLAARLDSVRFVHALKAVGDVLQRLEAFQVAVQGLAPAPGLALLMASAAEVIYPQMLVSLVSR
jgi:hypothetical protein